jgi:hypothetical protein
MARREVTGRKPNVSADLRVRSDGPRILDPEEVEPTQHNPAAARAVAPVMPIRGPSPTPRLALTISQFCEAFNISEAFYYKLKKQRQGPREMKVGARTLISLEAADAWRREREARRG